MKEKSLEEDQVSESSNPMGVEGLRNMKERGVDSPEPELNHLRRRLHHILSFAWS